VNTVARMKQFAIDVRMEMSKVTWPTRPQIIESTRLVLAMTGLLAAYLSVWDLLASHMIQWMLR
jgi:preprotein translocase SecE subunit